MVPAPSDSFPFLPPAQSSLTPCYLYLLFSWRILSMQCIQSDSDSQTRYLSLFPFIWRTSHILFTKKRKKKEISMIHCNIHKPNAKGLLLPNEGLLFGSVSNGNMQSSRDSFLSAVRKLKLAFLASIFHTISAASR